MWVRLFCGNPAVSAHHCNSAVSRLYYRCAKPFSLISLCPQDILYIFPQSGSQPYIRLHACHCRCSLLAPSHFSSWTVLEFAAGIGSRIKYLVDTPEMIWGHLDTHEYLDAARRFLQVSAKIDGLLLVIALIDLWQLCRKTNSHLSFLRKEAASRFPAT